MKQTSFNRRTARIAAIIIIGLFGLLGLLALRGSLAASYATGAEAESTAPAGNAARVTIGGASGGSAVRFGNGGTTPPTGSLPTLRVSDNRRFLVKQDGSPFFWLGDTAWALFREATREQVVLYTDTRASQGYNVVQAVGIFSNNPNRYGDRPMTGSSVASLATTPGNNPANATEYDYWDHVDYTINEAAKRGLYTALVPYWSRDGAGSVITASNAEAFGRWLGQRYANKPVIWVAGGDHSARHPEVWRPFARGIALGLSGSEDYSRFLMTYHPNPGSSSDTFHNDAWLDFNMLQSGHCVATQLNYNMITSDYNRSPTKPVLDGEPLYEEHPICHDVSRGYSTVHQIRKLAYFPVFAGAFGHTYGHHSVWQMNSPNRQPANGARSYWYDAINHTGGRQMQHLRKLMESRPFLNRLPDQSIITSGTGSGMGRIMATRAADGAYLMVYSPDGQSFSVNLAKVSGSQARSYWYDPRSGAVTDLGSRATGGSASFTPPSSGTNNDWVLVIDDASRGFGQPGRP